MLRRLLSILIILSLSLGAISTASAKRLTDLYTGAVPVAEQSKAMLAPALQQALLQVLVKVSGNAHIGTLPKIKQQLAKADNWLQQYSYQDNPAASNGVQGQLPAYLLRARFDANAINQLLQHNGQAVWGNERPETLLWLVIKDNGQERLFNPVTDSDLAQQVLQVFKAHGLPLSLPLMDLQDLSSVSVKIITEQDFDKLHLASERYHSNAMLIGELTQQDSQWHGQWTYVLGSEHLFWQSDASSEQAVLNYLAAAMSDALASRYAVLDNGNQEPLAVRMTISNVNDLATYSRIIKYLNGLTAVTDVKLVQLSAHDLIVDLHIEGSETALTNLLSMDTHLQAQMTPSDTEQNDATQAMANLYYQWQG